MPLSRGTLLGEAMFVGGAGDSLDKAILAGTGDAGDLFGEIMLGVTGILLGMTEILLGKTENDCA